MYSINGEIEGDSTIPLPALDPRFFDRIALMRHGPDGFYESYKAVFARSTMVLFSRLTMTPLAALILKLMMLDV
jgi:hypothetical protein